MHKNTLNYNKNLRKSTRLFQLTFHCLAGYYPKSIAKMVINQRRSHSYFTIISELSSALLPAIAVDWHWNQNPIHSTCMISRLGSPRKLVTFCSFSGPKISTHLHRNPHIDVSIHREFNIPFAIVNLRMKFNLKQKTQLESLYTNTIQSKWLDFFLNKYIRWWCITYLIMNFHSK